MEPGFPFNDAYRDFIRTALAGFTRLPDGAASGLKRAAVALTLLETADGSGEAGFVLTRRAATLRAHTGQYALPGGRCDPSETPEQTALRELHEELGIAAGPLSVLGRLDDYATRSGYVVSPVVVWAGLMPRILADPREVAAVHRVGLTVLMDPGAISFVRIPESDRPVLRIRMLEMFLHAPTAVFLYQLRELLLGRHTRVDGLEQPLFAWR